MPSARARVLVTVAAVVMLAAGCSSGSNPSDASTSTLAPSTTTEPTTSTAEAPTAREIPEGPAADLSEELVVGGAPFIGAALGAAVPDGYVETEVVAGGAATSYEAVGELGPDGRWSFEASEDAADYRTRVLVRRPADVADFSGTVIVEWLNVSSGIDANPDYGSLEEEIVRKGHAWVGVSAQRIGVEGGAVLVSVPGVGGDTALGLKGTDPERYGSLSHPGDGYSFDIFTQIGRALRAGDPVLGGGAPEVVLAAGESQSAIALTTYYNGVQPLTEIYDGFFIHSRAAVSLPLVGPGESADLASAFVSTNPTVLRDDVAVPVIELQAESDVIGVLDSHAVRQADSDVFRLWEVAGTAHADAHLLGPLAATIDCGVAINDGPLHIVSKAALRGLERWVRMGEAPPSGAVLEVEGEGAERAIVRDADGIALGGVRTPSVDVPLDTLTGDPGPNEDLICLLLGSTTPLGDERIAQLHGSQADYVAAYEAATDETIEAGFALEEDRAAMIGYSQPQRVAG